MSNPYWLVACKYGPEGKVYLTPTGKAHLEDKGPTFLYPPEAFTRKQAKAHKYQDRHDAYSDRDLVKSDFWNLSALPEPRHDPGTVAITSIWTVLRVYPKS